MLGQHILAGSVGLPASVQELSDCLKYRNHHKLEVHCTSAIDITAHANNHVSCKAHVQSVDVTRWADAKTACRVLPMTLATASYGIQYSRQHDGR